MDETAEIMDETEEKRKAFGIVLSTKSCKSTVCGKLKMRATEEAQAARTRSSTPKRKQQRKRGGNGERQQICYDEFWHEHCEVCIIL